jgi:hypothetical protein
VKQKTPAFREYVDNKRSTIQHTFFPFHWEGPPRKGAEQGPDSSENQGVALPGGAESSASSGDSASIDPDLTNIIAAWPGLPEAVRQQVVAMVREVAG